MSITLAFDVYGTLIDTAGITAALRPFAGDRAPECAGLWREKQLEYSFRRGLMQNYRHFADCTSQALDYTCRALAISLSDDDREALMGAYRTLPPFPDSREALPHLQADGYRLFAFSNGRSKDVAALLAAAGLDNFFAGIVSTDEIRSFKPNPAVYAHFLRRAGACGHEAWLISGNPFDVIGALSAGMKAAWVRRSDKALFDPWEFEPTVTIASLKGLKPALARRETHRMVPPAAE